MTTKLGNLKAIEVSVVPKGANKQNFLILKEEDGMSTKVTLDEVLKQEGFTRTLDKAVLKKFDEILKGVTSEKGVNAVKAAMRVLHAAGEDVPKDVMMKIAEAAGLAPEAKEAEGNTPPPAAKPTDGDGKKEPTATSAGSEADDDEDEDDEEELKEGNMDAAYKMVKKADGSYDMTGVPKKVQPILRTLWKQQEESDVRVAKAEQAAQTERDLRVTKEFVDKVAVMKNLGEKPEVLGPILKEISEKAPKAYEKLEVLLKALDAKVSKSGLFREVGSNSQGMPLSADAQNMTEAEAKIEAIAMGMVEKDGAMTKQQAVRKAWNSNPALYAEHRAESDRRKRAV